VVGRMTFLYSDEEALARGADLTARFQRHGHPGFSPFETRGMGANDEVHAGWGGARKSNFVRSGDGARGLNRTVLVHQRHRRRPIPMAIEQGPDDSTVDHPRKGLVMRFGSETGDQSITFTMRVNAKSLCVCWAATEANGGRSVKPLHAGCLSHGEA
jgi:hypothetical protein